MMQAASRESYHAARDALLAYAGTADPAELATAAEQVLAFAVLLKREPRLRRALTDPSRTGAERAGLAQGLLTGKVGADAAQLIGSLAQGRWSAPSELLDATELLGVDALLVSADRAGDLTEVEDELFRFGQIVAGDTGLAVSIADSSVPAANRIELVRGLLAGKAKPVTVRLAEQAVSGFGGRSFAAGLTRLVELAAERRDAEVAYVTVAEPLLDAAEARLVASLSGIYGRQISAKVTVDPQVLGGMSVRIGSDLYDGTVASRLAAVRTALTN